jgi:hypothetical protein
VFVLVEFADEATPLDWLTAPPLPGLRTFTGRFELLAPAWDAPESAAAACPLTADWFDVWMPLPVWSWLAPWVVEFEFDELASEDAVLLWVTAPSFPGLSTRTSMFELLGAICVAPEADVACCALSALWLTDCTPGDAAAAVPAPAPSSRDTAAKTDAMCLRLMVCVSPSLERWVSPVAETGDRALERAPTTQGVRVDPRAAGTGTARFRPGASGSGPA